jgi:hypothetical protein
MRQELGVKFHGTGGLELAQALKNEAKCGDDLIGAELLVISVKIESPRVIEYKPAGPGGSLAEVVFAVDNKELLEFEVEGNIEVFDGRAANRVLKVLNGLVLSAGKIKVVIRSPPDSPKHWDDSHVEEAMRKTSARTSIETYIEGQRGVAALEGKDPEGCTVHIERHQGRAAAHVKRTVKDVNDEVIHWTIKSQTRVWFDHPHLFNNVNPPEPPGEGKGWFGTVLSWPLDKAKGDIVAMVDNFFDPFWPKTWEGKTVNNVAIKVVTESSLAKRQLKAINMTAHIMRYENGTALPDEVKFPVAFPSGTRL